MIRYRAENFIAIPAAVSDCPGLYAVTCRTSTRSFLCVLLLQTFELDSFRMSLFSVDAVAGQSVSRQYCNTSSNFDFSPGVIIWFFQGQRSGPHKDCDSTSRTNGWGHSTHSKAHRNRILSEWRSGLRLAGRLAALWQCDCICDQHKLIQWCNIDKIMLPKTAGGQVGKESHPARRAGHVGSWCASWQQWILCWKQ